MELGVGIICGKSWMSWNMSLAMKRGKRRGNVARWRLDRHPSSPVENVTNSPGARDCTSGLARHTKMYSTSCS